MGGYNLRFLEKTLRIDVFCKIIAQKFAYVKKKQYFCTRFRKKAPNGSWLNGSINGQIVNDQMVNEARKRGMVVIAQLAEHRIVVPSVVGFMGKTT